MEENQEPKKRGRKPATIENIIQDKANEINFMESFGTIIFKNGVALKVRRMFEYFQQNWFYFMSAFSSGDEKITRKMLSDLNGGIISNGEVSINLADVSAMVAIYEMMENDGKKRRAYTESLDDNDEALRRIEFD